MFFFKKKKKKPHKYEAAHLFDSVQQPLQEVLSLGITLLSFC